MSTNPFEALERVFHEPHRLAIVSSLAASEEGKTFGELKEECGLTDGNLSRHLAALREGGAVRIVKKFVRLRPRTTVTLTRAGREAFLKYLRALREVLEKAAKAAVSPEPSARAERELKRLLAFGRP